jgi:hypothetical protein
VPENIHEVIGQHHVFYEVQPYYTVLEERTQGSRPVMRRIQAGFDIDVFGIKTSSEQKPGADYLVVYSALQKLVEAISPHSESCSVEVIPFGSTVIIDTKRGFQQEGMLRIRIKHRGVDQPAGVLEERVLKELKERLHNLGLRQG